MASQVGPVASLESLLAGLQFAEGVVDRIGFGLVSFKPRQHRFREGRDLRALTVFCVCGEQFDCFGMGFDLKVHILWLNVFPGRSSVKSLTCRR